MIVVQKKGPRRAAGGFFSLNFHPSVSSLHRIQFRAVDDAHPFVLQDGDCRLDVVESEDQHRILKIMLFFSSSGNIVFDSSTSLYFWILPLAVMGYVSTKATCLGIL